MRTNNALRVSGLCLKEQKCHQPTALLCALHKSSNCFMQSPPSSLVIAFTLVLSDFVLSSWWRHFSFRFFFPPQLSLLLRAKHIQQLFHKKHSASLSTVNPWYWWMNSCICIHYAQTDTYALVRYSICSSNSRFICAPALITSRKSSSPVFTSDAMSQEWYDVHTH